MGQILWDRVLSAESTHSILPMPPDLGGTSAVPRLSSKTYGVIMNKPNWYLRWLAHQKQVVAGAPAGLGGLWQPT